MQRGREGASGQAFKTNAAGPWVALLQHGRAPSNCAIRPRLLEPEGLQGGSAKGKPWPTRGTRGNCGVGVCQMSGSKMGGMLARLLLTARRITCHRHTGGVSGRRELEARGAPARRRKRHNRTSESHQRRQAVDRPTPGGRQAMGHRVVGRTSGTGRNQSIDRVSQVGVSHGSGCALTPPLYALWIWRWKPWMTA